MQNIFTCFLLGMLVWAMQRASPPLAEPTAYIGLLAVVSVLAARLTGRWGLSPPVGALATGFLLKAAGLLPDTILLHLRPFVEFATVWVGMFLGAFLSPIRISDRRLLAVAGLLVLGSGLTTALLQMAVYRIALSSAVGIGITATLAAPFFLPQRSESLSLSLITSGAGVLLWSVYRIPSVPAASAEQFLFDLAIWGAGIELTYRILRKARTASGQYVTLCVLALLILLACRGRQLPPLVLASLSGFALSMRCGKNRRFLPPLRGLSKLLVLPVLADFSARLGPIKAAQLEWVHWEYLLVYAAGMGAGKMLGGLLGSRLTGLPFREWAQVLPQGMLACRRFPQALATGGVSGSVFPPSGAMATGLLLLCGIGIQMLLNPLTRLADILEDRRVKGRSLEGNERHLQDASD